MEMEMDSHPHHLSDQYSFFLQFSMRTFFLLKERMLVITQSMTVRYHNRQMRRLNLHSQAAAHCHAWCFSGHEIWALRRRRAISSIFGEATKFSPGWSSSGVRGRLFFFRQVDGCSPYVPSIKDLARKREAAKAKGKAHDPNLGKLGVSMIDSCIKDRKYHENILTCYNFVSSFPLAPNAIHPPWHQQWDSLFQLCEGFHWSPKKKAPSPSLGLGSHATLTAH